MPPFVKSPQSDRATYKAIQDWLAIQDDSMLPVLPVIAQPEHLKELLADFYQFDEEPHVYYSKPSARSLKPFNLGPVDLIAWSQSPRKVMDWLKAPGEVPAQLILVESPDHGLTEPMQSIVAKALIGAATSEKIKMVIASSSPAIASPFRDILLSWNHVSPAVLPLPNWTTPINAAAPLELLTRDSDLANLPVEAAIKLLIDGGSPAAPVPLKYRSLEDVAGDRHHRS